MIRQFIGTSWELARTGQWAQLATYFDLIRELLATPQLRITVGKAKDKPQ